MPVPAATSMGEPIAWLNGEFIPLREARLPIWDLGLVQAVTVTEALRTFRHVPFEVDRHLERFNRSLRGVGVQPEQGLDEIGRLIEETTRLNTANRPADEDVVVNLFVTAGESRVHSGGLARNPGRPTLCISVRPLELTTARKHYVEGLSLVIPTVRHIPAAIIDPRIKYRSRLHWHLAEREVQAIDPEAEALLLDLEGNVTETARGNVFARFGNRLSTPPEETTLPGISQAYVAELCAARGIPVERRSMSPDDLNRADELFVSTTSACLVPVTTLNGRPIGDGRPGHMWRDLIADWSQRVEVDIVGQALRSSEFLNSGV
jgi:branched-chain amino acid aminotransferase